MRLAKRSTAFRRLYDKNYKFNYFSMLVNILLKKGLKLKAFRIIKKFVFLLKVKYKKSIFFLFNNVFNNYLPLISFVSKKVAAIKYTLPWYISLIKSKILFLKWFITATLKRKEHSLVLKLYSEYNDLVLGYGKTVRFLEDYYSIALKNRPFLRFLRKKRKVFLSRIKKFGIK